MQNNDRATVKRMKIYLDLTGHCESCRQRGSCGCGCIPCSEARAKKRVEIKSPQVDRVERMVDRRARMEAE